jgi:3-deoxy-D-manno-octulosonic-acid transferase
MGFALTAYIALAHIWRPFWKRSLRRRAASGKEDATRIAERFGQASALRPDGPLLWVHALGIGEASAMLAVIEELRRDRPNLHVLLTTNTRTGADGLLQRGLPDGVTHQYAPLDTPSAVTAFLRQWHPDVLLLAELDLWPLMLSRLRAAQVPMVMANARLTDRRFRNRNRIKALMRDVLPLFEAILVQDATSQVRMAQLGAPPVRVSVAGLLKAAAPALPDRPEDRARFNDAIGRRPVWLAAATEARELPALIEAHEQARQSNPDLLMILAPRQLTDADAAAEALTATFGTCPRRSKGDLPTPADTVFLADSMGEMGLWYRLAPMAFVGHSLSVEGAPLTGKNPFEAAALGVAVLHGPCVGNFSESYQALAEGDACVQVAGASGLAEALTQLLEDPERTRQMTDASLRTLEQQRGALPLTVAAVLCHFPPPAP